MNVRGVTSLSVITVMIVALFTLTGPQVGARAQELPTKFKNDAKMQAAPTRSGDSEINKQIARIRAATAKYHDVNVAIADGFLPLTPCIEIPGAGTDGIHYTNLARFITQGVVLEEPEQLVYIPTRNGGVRLVSVEYDNLALYIDTTGAIPGVFPSAQVPLPANFLEVAGPFSIANQSATGPFIDPAHGTPWFYFKHVWVWAENPNGIFADFNPRLSCTPGD